MQLFELEMPDPFRPWEMVHIAAPMPQDSLVEMQSTFLLLSEKKKEKKETAQRAKAERKTACEGTIWPNPPHDCGFN